MVVDHLHAGRPRDLTITAAHRAALRRIGSGEPVSELGDALGALYLHDLIRDDGGRIVLTEDGVGLLAAHDRLAETRRVERPRLEPRPLPPRWSIDIAYGVYVHEEYGPLLRLDAGPEVVEERIRIASDALDLYRWVQHSRAVEAQEAER